MGDERGFSESTQWALLTPMLLLVLLTCLQTGLWWQGRMVADHAASAGAQVESVLRPRPGEGTRVATEIATAGGMREVVVQVRRSPARVQVRVTGRLPLLVDLGMAEVSQDATVPVEHP